ncbi:hypothetical protein B7P33_06485 [Sediminicola luteus]|uniref:Uncharacterized protein n=1 Tax=Sediminicola luteus TaxID=319238 RepID=A0A2A4G8Q4_9FLAO|nr:hypothetical protein B7P33_06485 [Sediminicola luteus]
MIIVYTVWIALAAAMVTLLLLCKDSYEQYKKSKATFLRLQNDLEGNLMVNPQKHSSLER